MLRSALHRVTPLLVGGSLLVTLASGDVYAQTDRDVLRGLLKIYYVDQPDNADESYRPGLLDNGAAANGTEAGPFWTNPAMHGAQDLVRRLLRDQAGGGDAALQLYVARIVQILNKPVKVNLLDDTRGPITDVAWARWGACRAGGGWAWPCASNMSLTDDDAAACAARLHQPAPARHDLTWAGSIALGETYMDSAASPVTALSTFVHELVHTQDYADWRGHLFWINGRTYRYGADDVHYSTEAVPDLAMTYKEGLANGFRLLYDGARTQEMFEWFATNGELLVEKNFTAEGSGPGAVGCHDAGQPSPDNWLYNQLSRLGVHEARSPLEVRDAAGNLQTVYAVYHVRDLPPRFVAHNEYILAMIIQQYVTHAGVRPFMTALASTNQRLLRVSGSGIATLIDFMSRVGLPEGATAASVATRSGPKPYLLPLAYVDYFTGYRAATTTQFKAFFENMGFMDDWINLYWDGERQKVLAAVPPPPGHPMTMEDLTSIAMALGVTQSTP